MVALQTTIQGKSRGVKQARDFTKSELINGLPTNLRDGLVPRVTKALAAFCDSLNRPAMSHRERVRHKTVAAVRERDKFWSGTDIFFMGP